MSREIASLLHTPTLADYTPHIMNHEVFLTKIDRAEAAYQNGEVTYHEDVKKRIAT